MKTHFKIIPVLMTLILLFSLTSCGDDAAGGTSAALDREGNSITLPKNIEKIISLGPSNTEILVALGHGGKIIAVDTYSDNIPGTDPGIPMFDMLAPDGEQLINLQPDVIFVTGMSREGGGNLLKSVSDSGICVIYIPSSSSIEAIKEDIMYIAAVMDTESLGEEIVSGMESAIADFRKTGESIAERRKVYFEIEAAPHLCTFGDGVFLNELIEIIGADNVFGGQNSWFRPTDESVLHADPDVILTSVNYIEDPVGEIKSRPGWNEITAVKNNEVYFIDTDSSNRPSHNIIKAMDEMARAVYPDIYN